MGQQSILHAVRTPQRLDRNNMPNDTIRESISESDLDDSTGSKPMNETLTDLSLEESNEDDQRKEPKTVNMNLDLLTQCSAVLLCECDKL